MAAFSSAQLCWPSAPPRHGSELPVQCPAQLLCGFKFTGRLIHSPDKTLMKTVCSEVQRCKFMAWEAWDMFWWAAGGHRKCRVTHNTLQKSSYNTTLKYFPITSQTRCSLHYSPQREAAQTELCCRNSFVNTSSLIEKQPCQRNENRWEIIFLSCEEIKTKPFSK